MHKFAKISGSLESGGGERFRGNVLGQQQSGGSAARHGCGLVLPTAAPRHGPLRDPAAVLCG